MNIVQCSLVITKAKPERYWTQLSSFRGYLIASYSTQIATKPLYSD